MTLSTEVCATERYLLSMPRRAAAQIEKLLCAGTASTVDTTLRLFRQSFGKAY